MEKCIRRSTLILPMQINCGYGQTVLCKTSSRQSIRFKLSSSTGPSYDSGLHISGNSPSEMFFQLNASLYNGKSTYTIQTPNVGSTWEIRLEKIRHHFQDQ